MKPAIAAVFWMLLIVSVEMIFFDALDKEAQRIEDRSKGQYAAWVN